MLSCLQWGQLSRLLESRLLEASFSAPPLLARPLFFSAFSQPPQFWGGFPVLVLIVMAAFREGRSVHCLTSGHLAVTSMEKAEVVRETETSEYRSSCERFPFQFTARAG
jgi:hypothetical protein